MLSKINTAIELAARGFHVFPLRPNSKLPAIKNWQNAATNNAGEVVQLWAQRGAALACEKNIGICTTRYGSDAALIVVDIDNKGSRKGDSAILQLELSGCLFPKTLEAATPSGGRHLYYRTATPVTQGVNVLGQGVDIRSRGGYVVAPGSQLWEGLGYTWRAGCAGPMPAPEWLVERLARSGTVPVAGVHNVDISNAYRRALDFLTQADTVTEGARNQRGYVTACRLKDFGVGQDMCLALMSSHWACDPKLDADEMEQVVRSAYKYGESPVGVASPEAEFARYEPLAESPTSKVGSPFDRTNDEYAFCTLKGSHVVLHETTDPDGEFSLDYMVPSAFHARFAAWKMLVGKKEEPVTTQWMQWGGRRSYEGVVFWPGRQAPTRFYNLWRGFRYEPVEGPASHPALSMFLEHALHNVCNGDKPLCDWLIGWFAHLVQRPWEKPLTALVFRGEKGVGKNALIERVGSLLGPHFLVASNRRYLISQFNGHLESLLLFALDEAFWSGDKQAEGQLKDLITGAHHVIERKGYEAYKVDNRTRVVIIGNEEWLVPASNDERRFAVFDVGTGRKQDRAFFTSMRLGMESGGYGHLLRYLLDAPIGDVNCAPVTDALHDQKAASLELTHQWWRECLDEQRIQGSDVGGWPALMHTVHFQNAFRRYANGRNVRGRIPDDRVFGKELVRCAPSIKKVRYRVGGDLVNAYALPLLEVARKEWSDFMGHDITWAE